MSDIYENQNTGQHQQPNQNQYNYQQQVVQNQSQNTDQPHQANQSQYQNQDQYQYQYQNNGPAQYQNNNQKNSQGNGFAITSFVLGIISLVLFCTCINIPVAIVAIVFGIIHLTQKGKNGLAIAGIATAGASLFLLIVFSVLYSAAVLEVISDESLPYYYESFDYNYEETY